LEDAVSTEMSSLERMRHVEVSTESLLKLRTQIDLECEDHIKLQDTLEALKATMQETREMTKKALYDAHLYKNRAESMKSNRSSEKQRILSEYADILTKEETEFQEKMKSLREEFKETIDKKKIESEVLAATKRKLSKEASKFHFIKEAAVTKKDVETQEGCLWESKKNASKMHAELEALRSAAASKRLRRD